MSKIACPVCGSESIKSLMETRKVYSSSGEAFDAKVFHDVCEECHFEGDFLNRNEALILKQKDEFEASAFTKVIASLSNQGLKMASIERAVGLPARTIARWKRDGGASAGLALLSLINVFPWMLKVASANYDRRVADEEMMAACSEALSRIKVELSSFHGHIGGWEAIAQLSGGEIKINEKYGFIYVSNEPLTKSLSQNYQELGRGSEAIDLATSSESANVFTLAVAKG